MNKIDLSKVKIEIKPCPELALITADVVEGLVLDVYKIDPGQLFRVTPDSNLWKYLPDSTIILVTVDKDSTLPEAIKALHNSLNINSLAKLTNKSQLEIIDDMNHYIENVLNKKDEQPEQHDEDVEEVEKINKIVEEIIRGSEPDEEFMGSAKIRETKASKVQTTEL